MYDSVNLLLGLGICRVHVLCMQQTKTVFSGATFSSSLPIRTATQEMRDEDESCTLCAFHLITTDRFRGVKYCKILQAVCNITAVHQSNYRRLISIKKYWREGEREEKEELREQKERGERCKQYYNMPSFIIYGFNKMYRLVKMKAPYFYLDDFFF